MNALSLELKQDDGDVLLAVRVAPRSSRDAILGVHAGALKMSLTAPPVDGKANESLTTLLSKALHVPRSAITIERGDHGRNKTIRIHNIDLQAVQSLLGPYALVSTGKGARDLSTDYKKRLTESPSRKT